MLSQDFKPSTVVVVVRSTAKINSTFCTEVESWDLIVDDVIDEDDQTFTFELQFSYASHYPDTLANAFPDIVGPPIPSILSPNSIVITIEDNDGKNLICLARSINSKKKYIFLGITVESVCKFLFLHGKKYHQKKNTNFSTISS